MTPNPTRINMNLFARLAELSSILPMPKIPAMSTPSKSTKVAIITKKNGCMGLSLTWSFNYA
jgi:hypothetical protein